MTEFIDTYFGQCTGGGPLAARLLETARNGHLCLKSSEGLPSFEGFIHDQGRWYLQRNWMLEGKVIQHLKRLLTPLSPVKYTNSELSVEQQSAVELALSHSISVICGGPGTGKTFIAYHLIQALGEGKKIILTAPTGKAAARLKSLNPLAMCGTLHSLLRIRSERDLLQEGSYLEADLIVVDESSMIDVQLLGYFLASIPPGVRIVFLGDANQLPPVEAGSLFVDFMDVLPTARLTQSFRSNRKDVLDLSQAILEGKTVEVHPFSLSSKERFLYEGPITPKMFDHFRYLSCVREGPWGVDTLNRRLFEIFYHRMKEGQELAVPILITRNHPKIDLYNGDTAVAVFKKEGLQYALLPDGRKIPSPLLPAYEKAYCISIHKSQGSEFDAVEVIVPPGSEVFGKEILYTGVTRAKKEAFISGDRETVTKMLSISSRKASGFRERWGDFPH